MYGVFAKDRVFKDPAKNLEQAQQQIDTSFKPFKTLDRFHASKAERKNLELLPLGEEFDQNMAETVKDKFRANQQLPVELQSTISTGFRGNQAIKPSSTIIGLAQQNNPEIGKFLCGSMTQGQSEDLLLRKKQNLQRQAKYQTLLDESMIDEYSQVHFTNGKLFDDAKFEQVVLNAQQTKKNPSVSEVVDHESHRQYSYLKQQYELYLKDKIQQSLANLTDNQKKISREKVDEEKPDRLKISIDDLYKEWKFSKERFPVAYHKFVADFLTEDERIQLEKKGDDQKLRSMAFKSDLKLLSDYVGFPGNPDQNFMPGGTVKPFTSAKTINLLLEQEGEPAHDDAGIFGLPGNYKI